MTSVATKEVPKAALSLIEPTVQRSERRTAIASYLLALLLGLSVAHYMFPTAAIFARDTRVRPMIGYDADVEVYAQRYFTKDAWRWPLLWVKTLGAPEGINVGYVDGVPLIQLTVKLFRHVLPPDFNSVYLWLALCWITQPVAAVFALRSAGEKRLLPNLAVAVIAVSMPTLLFRFVHCALCSHFLILIALGLYFRIVREATVGNIVAADVCILAALLVNPYIMEMVIAVLAAAPLTLLIRRERAWMPVAGAVAAGVAITAAIALLLGYGHTVPMGGFGTYSMNLLSPIYPGMPYSGDILDATTGQYEGYQYLGMGVILLLLFADFCLSMPERLMLLRRHAGLVFSCAVLTFLALSTKVYAGHRLLLDLPTPSWLLQLRGSGRLFWPVTYTAIIAGILIVCRKVSARWAVVALLVFSSVQYLDSMHMRREIRKSFRNRPEYTVDTALFRSLLADHSKLIVWPKFGCGADVRVPQYSDVYMLASEVAIPVNMTYTGRFTKWPDCNLSQVPVSVAANELWVFVPQWNPGMVESVADWRTICRQSGVLVVCAQDLRGRTDLPLPNVPYLPLGKTLSTAADGAGSQWLASGWYDAEPSGTWSHGASAYLVAAVDKPLDKSLMLRVWATGLAVHPSTTQKVTVFANGNPIAVWAVKEGVQSEYSAVIPAPLTPARSIFVEFRIEQPTSPKQQGTGADDRELGFSPSAFRFDEQGSK